MTRRLTVQEVREQYGGRLPPDAVLRADDEPAEFPPPPPRPSRPARTPRRTQSERFAVLNAFVDMGMADLTGAEIRVWLVLFRDTKGTGTARTGQADIARRAGLSRRGVQIALERLQSRGMVRIAHRGRLNAGPSAYRVHPTGTV